MAETIDRKYLGTGWSFPPSFSKSTQETDLVSEEEDIAQSLEILLSTRPGERIMQSNYGCNLDIMLFEPLTTSLITIVKNIIDTAIVFHEPRINLNRIDIDTQETETGLVLIKIDYTIRNLNSRFNLVFPFYLDEGANVSFT